MRRIDKVLVEHFDEPTNEYTFIWISVHLRNRMNVRQMELLIIYLYSEGIKDRFGFVQHFRCRKICQIVCRIPRKWIESKFLDQDVDEVFLANKGIVIGSFVDRNYNKILTETGKLMDNIRVTKKWTRIWCWQNYLSRWILCLTTSPINLIHSFNVCFISECYMIYYLKDGGCGCNEFNIHKKETSYFLKIFPFRPSM